MFEHAGLQSASQRMYIDDGSKVFGFQAKQQKEMEEKYKVEMGVVAASGGPVPFCYNMNMLPKGVGAITGPPPDDLKQPHHVQQQAQSVVQQPPPQQQQPQQCYRFDVCSQQFSYNYALVNQMSLAAPYKCDVCGLGFAHSSLLSHHKRVHAAVASAAVASGSGGEGVPGDKAYGAAKLNKCETCGVEIESPHGSPSSKKKHGKYSSIEGRIKCESCEATAFAEAAVGGGHHPQNNHDGPVAGPLPGGKMHNNNRRVGIVVGGHHPQVRKCQKCNGSGMIFMGGAHGGAGNTTSTVSSGTGRGGGNGGGEKPFTCSVCDNTFSRDDSSQGDCQDKANMEMPKYSSLWSHKRLHTGEKPYKCEVCGMAFAKAAYLKNHGRVHTGEKPFKCEVCGMRFAQGPHLKNHERIHTGEKPYACEVCDKVFSRHSTLWNHRRIHTGEKPYRCDVCGSAFSQGTHLKNHKKVHTGEKPHRCDVCDVGFSDRFALKRHKGVHGGNAPVSGGPSGGGGTPVGGPPEVPGGPPEPPSATGPLELYKCEVGQVAFPGCSRPPDKPLHTG